METVTDFILGGSKITADGDCSHEIKRYLLLGRKVMTKLDSILKTKDIALSTKVHLVKAMVFPVVTYGCESWTIKKAEHQRTGAFKLWCWRRLLRVPWTARRSNQSILKEINPEYPLEGLMLKFQFLGHLIRRVTLWRRPDSRRDWGQEKGVTEDETAGWHHQLNGHEFEQTQGEREGQGSLACCSPCRHKKLDMTEWLINNKWWALCWVFCVRWFLTQKHSKMLLLLQFLIDEEPELHRD